MENMPLNHFFNNTEQKDDSAYETRCSTFGGSAVVFIGQLHCLYSQDYLQLEPKLKKKQQHFVGKFYSNFIVILQLVIHHTSMLWPVYCWLN